MAKMTRQKRVVHSNMGKFIPVICLILLITILFCLPKEILYSHGEERWIPFMLTFIIIPFLLYKTLISFGVSGDYSIIVAALFVFISTVGLVLILGNEEKTAFAEYGTEAKGVVYRKWYSSGRHTKSEWLIRCHFYVGNKQYTTFSESDKENKYKIGDTLIILYNRTFPEQCVIQSLRE